MMDTHIGTQENKDDPAEVAQVGFRAMLDGEADVVVGLGNELQVNGRTHVGRAAGAAPSQDG